MLLLVTIGLVLVGTVCLIFGFVQSSLPFIYVSIACSVLAAIVLVVFSRMASRSQQVVTAGEGPAPLDVDQTQAPAGAADADQAAFAPESPAAVEATQSVPAPAAEPARPVGGASPLAEGDEEDDYFPIEDYDSLRVAEIVPLLPELDLDELDMVREREAGGKARSTLLARIDQQIQQLEEEDAAPAPAAVVVTEPAPDVVAVQPVDAEDEAAEEEPEDDEVVEDELDEADEAELAPQHVAAAPVAVDADDDYFPIEDYDDLRAAEILPLLPELDDDELEMVRERERSGAARSSILRRIDALLPGEAPSAAAKPAPKAATKKAAPKGAPTRSTAPAPVAVAARKAPAASTPAPPAKGSASPSKAAAAKASKASSASKAAPSKAPAQATPAKATAARTKKAAATTAVAEASIDAAPAPAKKATKAKPAAKATKAAKKG